MGGCRAGGAARVDLPLSGHAEIFVERSQRYEFLPMFVGELTHVFIGMGHNAAGEIRSVDIVLQAFDEVGVVVAYGHVVVVGYEPSLHEPCLVARFGHDGQRVGRHDPFEVGGYVVALQREYELVFELFVERYLGPVPLCPLVTMGVALAQIAHRVAVPLLEKAYAVGFVRYVGAEYQPVDLLREVGAVVKKTEVAVLVEVEQYGGGIVVGYGAALDYRGALGRVRHVAEKVSPAQRIVEIPSVLVCVEEIGGRSRPMSVSHVRQRGRCVIFAVDRDCGPR